MVGEGIDAIWQVNNIATTTLAVNTTAEPRQFGEWRERHLSTMNTLYADGHVKAMRLDALAVPSNTGWPGMFAPLSIAQDPN